MTRRLLVGYLSITTVLVALLGLPLGMVFARLERDHLMAAVRQDAAAMALWAHEPLRVGDDAPLRDIADLYRVSQGGRVVVVDRDGRTRADSDTPDGPLLSFVSRPEVQAALAGRTAEGFRHSRTLGQDLFYEAVPINSGGVVRGAVRVTYPATVVHERIRRTWLLLAGVGLLAVAAVGLLSRILARSVTAPLRRLEETAAEFGRGRLDVRVPSRDGPPELRTLADVFNDTAGKLERLLESQTAFVADASHQLRTPLATLRLRLEIVERAGGPAVAEDVESAMTEVHRLSRLVDGLLALAAAEQRPTVREPVDVAGAVTARRDIWAPFAEERGASVVTRVHPATALLNPGAIEQVLDNLIANALEVSPRRGRVTLTVATAGGWIDVHVVDEGPGMSPEHRAAAFTRLWRAPGRPRGIGGSGLGLAIVRQLVEADGGHVRLDEAPGGGLDAHVRLPPAPGRPPARSAARPPVRRHAGHP